MQRLKTEEEQDYAYLCVTDQFTFLVRKSRGVKLGSWVTCKSQRANYGTSAQTGLISSQELSS